MESVLGRYRNLIILVGVLFLQVLGLAVQVKRSSDAENTRLIRIWAVDLITPFERGLVWVQSESSNLWRDHFYLRGVRAENRQLKEQIKQMRLEQVRLSEDAAQANRLQSLLAFKEQYIAKTVAAQVIGSSGSDLSRSIYIDKGTNDGIAPDMAVITAGGIVGKVLRSYPSTSLVLLINDQSSGAGAFLERSRLQGVLRGTPNGELILERVMSDETVAPGETVLSSGGDQIFPKGLLVGKVTAVSPGKEMFLRIKVKPAADLSRLEEVLVVTEREERQPPVAENVHVRAADILAQRLPSVPDKPKGAAGTAPAAAAATGTTRGAGTKVQPIGEGSSPNAPQNRAAATPGTATPAEGAGADSAHDATANGRPTTGALKKTDQIVPAGTGARAGNVASRQTKSNPSASAPESTSSGSPNAASTPAVSAAPNGTSGLPQPTSPAPKPATAPARPASTPPSPQPATADEPH